MVCRDVDKGDLAEKYLNGQLDPATQDDFELHILECLDCQHFLEALQAARDDLASHADEIRSHSSFTRGRLQWAWVGAAALSVIALSLGITRFALHREPTHTEVSQTVEARRMHDLPPSLSDNMPSVSQATTRVPLPWLRALIRNKADAPAQITEAFCGQDEEGNYCYATLEFAADTKETWNGYGLLWIMTYENGSKSPVYQAGDRCIEPTGPDGSFRPSGRFYPGEIVSSEGVWFGPTDQNGKTLRVTDAQVEVELVISTNGTVWGDSKSPTLKDMLELRKQAKEGAKKGTQ